jgi:hypothetical protein
MSNPTHFPAVNIALSQTDDQLVIGEGKGLGEDQGQ